VRKRARLLCFKGLRIHRSGRLNRLIVARCCRMMPPDAVSHCIRTAVVSVFMGDGPKGENRDQSVVGAGTAAFGSDVGTNVGSFSTAPCRSYSRRCE